MTRPIVSVQTVGRLLLDPGIHPVGQGPVSDEPAVAMAGIVPERQSVTSRPASLEEKRDKVQNLLQVPPAGTASHIAVTAGRCVRQWRHSQRGLGTTINCLWRSCVSKHQSQAVQSREAPSSWVTTSRCAYKGMHGLAGDGKHRRMGRTAWRGCTAEAHEVQCHAMR